MGPEYQATQDAYAASPQATSVAGNQTLGKAMEQSPVHNGFGTSSGMYDNGMDVSAQPAPVAMPPQPQNQPASAGINPSWAQQQGRNRGGRAKRVDGGPLAAFGGSGPVSPFMMTSDTLSGLGRAPQTQIAQSVPMSAPAQAAAPAPDNYAGQYVYDPGNIYERNLPNADFVKQAYLEGLAREPETYGYQGWLNDLMTGRLSQREVENRIRYSQEAGMNEDAINKARSALIQSKSPQMNTPEARQAMLAQGIIPDAPGSVDPFVSGYNARARAARSMFGDITRQNYGLSSGQRQEYERKLADVQRVNAERLAQAQALKARG